MPTAKKLRSRGPAPEPAPSEDPASTSELVSRSTPAGIREESVFVEAARKHWLKPTKKNAKVKVKNDVLNASIWEPLAAEGFQFKSLSLLESLQTLESYLWPGYTEASSNVHVVLIALIANVKHREHVETWSMFEPRAEDFSSMFRRVLALTLDATQPTAVRTQLLSFLIYAFRSLDCVIVRSECAPLVSISIWHNISMESSREAKLGQSPHVRKAWRASTKRFDAADEATKARLRFERSWLYTLVLDFLGLLYSGSPTAEHILYCERLTEFLCDLLSQLPTRRYVNALLQDLHVLPAMSLSPILNDEGNDLLRDLHALLSHYTFFIVDDQTGAQLGRTEAYERHCKLLSRLQHVSLEHFKEKLTVLALSHYGGIDKREDLAPLLEPLTNDEIMQMATLLHFRTSYPAGLTVAIDRKLLVEVMLSTFERQKTFREIAQSTSLLPTELSLFDRSLLRSDSYDGSHPLALPKLNLQYLSVGDFLWRTLFLYQRESFYAIRRDIELAVSRLKPKRGGNGEMEFFGFSKMAISCSKASILEVVPPLVGQTYPSIVRAEVTFDLRRMQDGTRRDWEALRPDDVIFLLSVAPPLPKSSWENRDSVSEAEKLGILTVRAAEVIQLMDDQGRAVRPGAPPSGTRRRLLVKVDAATYAKDLERPSSSSAPDAYNGVNVILRRHRRENNFKSVLESLRTLMLSDVPLPSWLHEVFLGYGDPAGATYKHLPNRVKTVDHRDTFLDWQHLIESLPGKIVDPDDTVSGSFPPYVLESIGQQRDVAEPKPSKKRRRGVEPALVADAETLKVSTYKPPNNGPYRFDAPKLSSVRFTSAQVEAIVSGTQPGLTVIVGPPGTGKTDVATQIINNIYHNFPEQKTILIAHSNQALNQLFAKIVTLDIDERHLLRLGHGEEELNTESNFSKHGRVESFLENRDRYLREVTRLAATVGAPGAHGNSAETAGYFHSVYILPAWAKYEQVLFAKDSSPTDIVTAFPFHHYFSDAPQPLFPPEADREVVTEIVNGCWRHISRIFSELLDAQPFELLRRDRDRTNYLLTNEARIIAMTATHAAMRRGEIAALGFHYDNVIMEEAAQVTEAESFVPLAMQRPTNGRMQLQRVVLCGDHYQNSPVIQNIAFRQYANLEQSLFSRLVRLGVPTITLDQQGRARPSIASLYQWRYPKLGNLTHVQEQAEFQMANAGFKFDYQFINVPNYKGRGESEPSPHFIQNLGEAEYAVAIYQYMRLLGYPASKVTILTTYAGQRALVRDVLVHRCAGNPIFGMPRTVATVDKYQGEQNDYIILSLTRTTKVGYLRDVRRMTVALSRARLGLYILGRREVFETCQELAPAFELLLQRPDKLMLIPGELWPSQRVASSEAEVTEGEAPMESVEHLGQYVFEMTNTKLQHMQARDRDVVFQDLQPIEEAQGERREGEGGEDEEELEAIKAGVVADTD